MNSIPEAKDFFEDILPDEEVRRASLTFLAESIRESHHASPTQWALYRSNGIVLRVGRSDVLKIGKNHTVVIVNSEKKPKELKGIEELTLKPTEKKFFRKSQGGYEWRFPTNLSIRVLPHVRLRHTLWIKEASQMPFQPIKHEELLASYIADFLTVELPSPNGALRTTPPIMIQGQTPPAEKVSPEESHVHLTNKKMFPEEVEEAECYFEGAVTRVPVNRYERDQNARAKCVEHFGPFCQVCGFRFDSMYGELGKGFIHVHHLRPLAEIKAGYIVDPINDLRPVCANCHAMLHQRPPPFCITELRQIMEGVNRDSTRT